MNNIIRKEVSCKVFTPTFEVLKRKNIDLNLALKNIPYSLDHLLNRHERIEWSVMCTFISNIRPYLSISDFEEMGAVDIRDGFNQEYVASGLLMFSLNKFSKRDGENIVKSGEHNVTCIIGEIVSTKKNSMKVKYYIDEEHEYFPEFVYVQRGGLLELGKLFGYKDYNVETIWVHNGAIFEVSWKNRRTFLGVKKWFFWIFNFRKAFLDLADSRAQLLNQYNKLEESKILIQKNAIQLKTAHEISKSIRQSLDISKTLNTIAETLINSAGFSCVYIKLFKDIEGNSLEVETSRKNEDVNTNPIKKQIVINDEEIGELIIYPKIGIEISECEELLKYILPIINISIHDSLVLRAIMDYKNNLEEKVTNRTVELEKAKDDLSNSNTLLKAAQKVQSNFFTNISHEFRTPLTLILGPVKQLLESAADENAKEQLKLIHRSARKLNRLVDELLDISKIESGEMKLRTSQLNIIGLVEEICKSFYPLAEKKKINFKVHSTEKEIIAYLDKNKFDKILSNVLSNAFKFTPEGGKVNLYIARKETDVEIIISDTGIGIPRDQVEKIFDRFYQIDGSHTREQEGTGIGLALTKELIDLHKAKIEVESEESKGSIFKLIFKLGIDHLAPDEINNEVVSIEETSSRNEIEFLHTIDDKNNSINYSAREDGLKNKSQLPTLLVVEDNNDVREYIKSILKNQYNILEANNGEEGIEKSFEHIPDLIISDIMMPKLDGFQLCSKLKTDSRTSHIPLIMLTAKATIKDKISGLEIGADEYIMKPFEALELVARIKNLIEQRKRIHQHFQKSGLFSLEDKHITPIDHKFLENTIELINKNISNTLFGVDILAESLAVSRSLLFKKISSLTGEAPIDIIKRIRLNRAAKLIENKGGNISEIALEVGFNNPSYFSECFRKQFGVSPSHFSSNSHNT